LNQFDHQVWMQKLWTIYFQPIKNRVSQLILLDRYCTGITNQLNQKNNRLKYWEKYRNADLRFRTRIMEKINQDKF